MKQILALLLTLIFSIFNNVSYQASDPPAFNQSYYRITGEEPTNYRDLYSDGVYTSAIGACTKTKYKVSSLLKNSDYSLDGVQTIRAKNHSKECTWVEAVTTTLDDLNACGDTYTFQKDGYIVAPSACTVTTSPNDGGGRTMTLQDNYSKYRFVFNSMERWCCCINRTPEPDEDGNVTWNHSLSIKGDTIAEGYCIGIATGGSTTFCILDENGNKVSIHDFYNNTL